MLSRNRLLLGVLVLAVIALCALAAFAQGQKSGNQPMAVIDTKSVNLGDIIEGQDVAYTFIVKNRGNAELQIISVRPG